MAIVSIHEYNGNERNCRVTIHKVSHANEVFPLLEKWNIVPMTKRDNNIKTFN